MNEAMDSNFENVLKELLNSRLIESNKNFEDIDPKSSLIIDGIIDSMAFVALLLTLEDRLGVKVDFTSMDMSNLVTIRGLCEIFCGD